MERRPTVRSLAVVAAAALAVVTTARTSRAEEPSELAWFTAHERAEREAAKKAATPEPHVHDGFYLQMSFGAGYGQIDSTDATFGPRTSGLQHHGMVRDFDLALGGTPWRGVALGVLARYASMDGGSGFGDASCTFVGLMVDGFPDVHGGFHVGGALGAGVLQFSTGGSGDLQGFRDGAGLGGAIWSGWDFWVGDQWSMGPVAKVSMLRASDDGNEDHQMTYTLSLRALLH